jgi:hypothetical protein
MESIKMTTLTAATTASPTTPEGAFHVLRPTDGILAPSLSSKYKGPCLAFWWSMFFYRNSLNHENNNANYKKKQEKKNINTKKRTNKFLTTRWVICTSKCS